MEIISKLFKIRSLFLCSATMFIALLFSSCEEQIDELWDADGDSQATNPIIGDWYADSIKSYSSCVKTEDSTSNVVDDSYIDNYNLWLLSDGSLQLFFDQSVNLKYECEDYYGTWSNSDGCSDSYYEYYDYTPIEFCNNYYEHNQYNIETTECSQSAAITGTWTSNETNSTVTVKMDSVCVNSFDNPSYITDADACNSLEYGNFKSTIERTFTYSIDNISGNVNLEGSWFNTDSSCFSLYMSLQ